MSDLVITIAREFGSGGRLIAKGLAEKLGYRLITRELIEKTALDLENAPSTKKEKIGNYFAPASVSEFAGASTYFYEFTNNQKYFSQSDAMRKLAEEGHCVILGRCADYIMRDYEKLLRIFLYADLDFCRATALERYGYIGKNVDKEIAKINKARRDYYRRFTTGTWGAPENYDLCINTAKLGFAQTENLIIEYVKIITGQS